jgi:3-methyl-2-oxobutanoate hydroxymethyltransferase
VSDEQAVANAGRFLKEAGADAVKLEGGRLRATCIQRIVDNGIPVMGHIGLMPQSVRAMGGYKVQGRLPTEAERLLADAKALEEAGVFALVLECVPAELAIRITQSVSMPTIGIGAGNGCDGQVLVTSDMLGITGDPPSFVKRYAALADAMKNAFASYHAEVASGAFPGDVTALPVAGEEDK